MSVQDVMSSPVTVSPSTSVGEIARLMVDKGIAGCPVVDDAGTVIGVVSQTDLVSKHANVHMPRYLGILGYVFPIDGGRTKEDLRHVLGVTARDLMSEDIISVRPDAEVDDAATLLVDERVDPVLVMDDHQLVGVVSRMDILRLLIIEEAEDTNSATTQPG